MARPRKPDGERRSKLFFVRLLPGELAELEEASRRRNESISAILRNGAALYLKAEPGAGARRFAAKPAASPQLEESEPS